MKIKKQEQGFTLIEMLVVLFVIGIIIAIAIPNLRSAGETAQKRADEANRKLIGAQVEQYYLENGSYPTSVKELVNKGYLRSEPKCPGGTGYYKIHKQVNLSSEQRVSCQK